MRLLIFRALQFCVAVLVYQGPIFASSQYLIPVFGTHIIGASGLYDSEVLVTNPHDKAVLLRIGEIYPLIAESCSACVGQTSLVLQARETSSLLGQTIFKDGRRLVLGAFTLVADDDVQITSWIENPLGEDVRAQAVPIARDALPANTTAWIPRAFRGGAGPQTINLFVVNPNDAQIVVRYGTGSALLPAVTPLNIPAKSTLVVPISFNSVIAEAPRRAGFPITLESDAPFYAVTSDGVVIRRPVD